METLGAVYLSCCCFGISSLAFVLSYLLIEKVPEQEKILCMSVGLTLLHTYPYLKLMACLRT